MRNNIIDKIILCIGFVFYSFYIQSQNIITGKVVDQTGEPMIGANVIVAKSKLGTITNFDGIYSIQCNKKDTLVFSYIGYETQKIVPGNRKNINVILETDNKMLNEVVVIGYGSLTKKDLSGAVGKINVEELNTAPVGTFTDALAGRLAGVMVTSDDGQPGANANIVIRGGNSLTQSNAPLYVIDGTPMEDFDPASISSEDIQSFNVLKDASAIAIYGARAANGVIVITTKKGIIGKPEISFSAKVGIPKITNMVEMMDTYEYVKYLAEYDRTRANTLYLSNYDKTVEDYRGVEGTDWQKEILNSNPWTMIYDLSIRGGEKNTRYSISASYNSQDGVIDNSGSSNFRTRVNLEHSFLDKWKMGVNINYNNSVDYGEQISTSGRGSTLITNVLYRCWAYRPYSNSGDLLNENIDDDMMDINYFMLNPVLSNENEHRKRIRNGFNINAFLEYKPIPSLRLRSSVLYNLLYTQNERFNNQYTEEGSPYNARNTKGQWGSLGKVGNNNVINENTATYDRSFNRHSLNTVIGFSVEKGGKDNSSFVAINVPYEELKMEGLFLGTPFSNTYTTSEYTMMSYFGRINYSYDSRYIITATFRGDGSSKFAEGNKWGYFPSAAFAWNISEEEFMRPIYWLSNFKFRSSYGLTGNNRISYLEYLGTLGTKAYYSFGNQSPSEGVTLGQMDNPFLRWESTQQLDLGIDVSFLKERINLTTDYYLKRTNDLLLDAQVPNTSGYTTVMQNIGKIQNSGLEVSLETVNIQNKNFTWKTAFNISFNRSKVLQLANGQSYRLDNAKFQTQYNNTPLYKTEVGESVGRFYGLKFDGIYQYEHFDVTPEGNYILKSDIPTNGRDRDKIQPGEIRYKDLNGDGTINDLDYTDIGSAEPLHFGGMNNSFRYANKRIGAIALSFLLQWSYGNDIFNANRLLFEGNSAGQTGLNQYKSYEQRWTPDNPSNTLFKAKGSGPQGFISDRTLEDGSYLRLKTVMLSYSLPNRWLKKIQMKSLSFNVSAQNLFTFTKYTGLDPEVSVLQSALTPGFDFCAYPKARTITFGLRVQF